MLMATLLLLTLEVKLSKLLMKKKLLFMLILVMIRNYCRCDINFFLLDPKNVESFRQHVALYDQRRFDIYSDVAESVVEENGKVTKKQ